MNSLRTVPIRYIRPIFPGLGRGLDLLLPSFLLSREEKREPAGLHLSPVGAICGAYAFAPYKRGCAPHLLSPFLSLMKEKEAKENQGVRDASQIYRVLAGDVRDTDPISHIRPIFPGLGRGLDLLLPSFLLSRKEKKVLADLCLSPIGAICGAYAFAPYKRGWRLLLLSPFLSLMRLNI